MSYEIYCYTPANEHVFEKAGLDLAADRLRLRGRVFGELGWDRTYYDSKYGLEFDDSDWKPDTRHVSIMREGALVAAFRLVATRASSPDERIKFDEGVSEVELDMLTLTDSVQHEQVNPGAYYMVHSIYNDAVMEVGADAVKHGLISNESGSQNFCDSLCEVGMSVHAHTYDPEAFARLHAVLLDLLKAGQLDESKHSKLQILHDAPPIRDDVAELSRLMRHPDLGRQHWSEARWHTNVAYQQVAMDWGKSNVMVLGTRAFSSLCCGNKDQWLVRPEWLGGAIDAEGNRVGQIETSPEVHRRFLAYGDQRGWNPAPVYYDPPDKARPVATVIFFPERHSPADTLSRGDDDRRFVMPHQPPSVPEF